MVYVFRKHDGTARRVATFETVKDAMVFLKAKGTTEIEKTTMYFNDIAITGRWNND